MLSVGVSLGISGVEVRPTYTVGTLPCVPVPVRGNRCVTVPSSHVPLLSTEVERNCQQKEEYGSSRRYCYSYSSVCWCLAFRLYMGKLREYRLERENGGPACTRNLNFQHMTTSHVLLLCSFVASDVHCVHQELISPNGLYQGTDIGVDS